IDKDSQQHWVSKDLDAKYNINTITNNYLYFSANIDDKSKFDIYRHKIPLLENEPEKIFSPSEGLGSISVVNNDETRAILFVAYSNIHSDLFLIDLEKESSQNLTEFLNKEKTQTWNAVRFLDDDHLLVNTDYKNDFSRPVILTTMGEVKLIKTIDNEFSNDFTAFEYKTDSADTYCTINEEGYSSLYKANFSTSGEVQLEKLDLPAKGVIFAGDQRSFTKSMHLNMDGTLLAYTFSSSTEPTNLFILDLKNKNSWKATNVSMPGLNQQDFSDATLHKLDSFDNCSVPYFKYLPKHEKPPSGWPSILIIHGGPEAQYQPTFIPIVQYFLKSGFAVIAPNIRGSRGYGRTYMDLDNKEKRLDSILDIKHLALHLKEKEDDIDGNKLIIYGGSYGGFAVLSAMTEHPELWRAGVDIVGISSFVTFLTNTAAWRRKLREGEYGSLEDDYEMLQSISPINKIDQIQAPLFIIQGDNDERVPLSESIQMHEHLLEKGLKTELLRFADEGHGITKLKNRLIAYPRIVEWLKEVVS
ncbi:MAG: alpha/beta hydrolase family protein, partial [Candidatus Kariarchaeaceae archaeon]